ncbi:type IV secretion system DNA-binding domain-containing protein [Patescibacteria group bacterium]|nr:type IV secretion system DNA-binding domain-containing protein [Patescibacteria group bacterium]MBU4056806.1 type IV secretion system DNA-binding domain-containing protein [Patescibacteria group bacterium]
MPDEITFFAETNYRGQKQRFGIKKDDRRRHIYIIGKTGMGKTTMLEHMVYSDIASGNGIALVDPHGDFAEKMLDYIPSSRVNDVIYFNPADIDWPIAFNVMEKVDSKNRHLVASGLIGVFKKIWADSWGPRLEYVLRNAILALLEYPGSTLLGVPRMLVDKSYRQKVVKKITDPVVRSFWVDEFSRYPDKFQAEAIAPIQNKIGQFLSSSLVRNIVSQTKSLIDLREVMDKKKILIINLAKGRIGEDYSALLGAMMITKIQLAAMSRVDMAESEREDFYLYVDEFQNFATESFANILSEARKYRLNLTIAHQYIGQLATDQNTVVRDAVFGNVGTIITFRVGATDAEYLEKEFEPVFMMNDLVNLAKYNVYLKLMIDGVTSDAFSATNLPPLSEELKKGNREKIIKISREKFATPRAVIEEKIMRWSGLVSENENNANSANKKIESETDALPKANSPAGGKNSGAKRENREIPMAEDNRKYYDAVCQKCFKKIKVPFEPDPRRKTYCRDCLKDIRQSCLPAGRSAASPGIGGQSAPRQKFISLEEAVKNKPESFKPAKKSGDGAAPARLVEAMAKRASEEKSAGIIKTGTIKPGEKIKFLGNILCQ